MTTQTTTVYLPKDLHARVKNLAKQLHTTFTHLVAEGLILKIDAVEAKEREEARRRAEAKADKSIKRVERRLHRMGAQPSAEAAALAPKPLDSTTESAVVTAVAKPAPPENSALAPIYEKHAALILAVLDKPTERRLRVMEAIAAVKKQAPLTYPKDTAILAALEREVLRMYAAMPEPEPEPEILQPQTQASTLDGLVDTLDALVGRAIDPRRIRSFGDVGDGT